MEAFDALLYKSREQYVNEKEGILNSSKNDTPFSF